MPRKKTKSLQRVLEPDRKHGSVLVQRLINKLMLDGQKLKSERIVYAAIAELESRAKKPGLEVLEQAIKNISPAMEVKSRRVGGANYQIPFEVKGGRQLHLALMWLVKVVRSKSGKPMHQRLTDELMSAYGESGDTFKKKEDTHKMAEANRAFAHLARF